MRILRTLPALAAVASVGLLVTACGSSLDSNSSSSSASGGTATLKIGFVSPETGPLAGFGEADTFVVDQMKQYFASHPIKAGNTTYNVEIVVKDAQSDSKRAGEVAAELINTDNVDIVLAEGTPDITNPVADQCEANATPCVTTVAPWQPYFLRRGGTKEKPFKWTYHFFWGLEDVAAVYQDMWNQVPTNKKVGGLFPNDADGQAWEKAFPDMIKANGYTLNDPGLYPDGTTDFTSQISKFKASDDQVLTGVPIPPDFTTFWKQAHQQGYTPKIATIGKALLFPSSVEALGDIANNLGTEVWWTPTYPYKSSLTGQSAQELADAYSSSTGKQWTQPLGFAESLFEVAAAAVSAAGSSDKAKVADALKTLKVDTVVGNLDWSSGPVPNVAKTPLTGGQWRKVPGSKYPFDLVIVSNSLAPNIPTGGKVEPLG